MSSPALQIFAGPQARRHLREQGLAPAAVRAVAAAAGGPKGLVLLPLDRYLFGHWLRDSPGPVHLLGASIGAWRMAAACLPDADAALAQLAEDYIGQTYPHPPGRMPTPAVISQHLGQRLQQRLGGGAAEAILAHPQRRLHVFTSRGLRLLHRPGRWALPMGWLAAFSANAVSRQALGGWMQRVVFSDVRTPLPLALADLPSCRAALTRENLPSAVLASCSIPFVLQAVADVPGGPPGSYWDGGITDYHLHLDYADSFGATPVRAAGLVLVPHFGPHLIPGWLDKPWRDRHRASPALDNVVLLAPHPEWVRRLPRGKLPDRSDFKTYGEDIAGRQRDWRAALAASRQLADELADRVASGRAIEALPLP